MNILEVFRSSWHGIAANKARSVLTLLGVLIGVCAVILLSAIGNGATSAVTSNISALGTNTISVRVNQSSSVRFQQLDAGAISAIRGGDAASAISSVVPVVNSSTTASSSSTSTTATVIGSTAAYLSASNLTVAQGTGISTYEESSGAKVVVIGSTLASDLFSTTNVVGKSITVNSSRYTINGVLQTTSSAGASDTNSQIVMPLSRMQASISGYGNYDSLVVVAKHASTVDTAMSEVESSLDTYFGVSDDEDSPVSVSSSTQLLSTLSSATSILTIMLAAVASISLLVAGIGVMNIMLVTVTERTREIGIRKALGATRGVILGQFLLEATVLSLMGGLGGMAVAMVLANFEIVGITPVIDYRTVIIAVGISVMIGVFFGSYPANRAAKMRPVDALRHD